MKRPVVLISAHKQTLDTGLVFYGTSYQVIEAVQAAGGLPLVVSDIAGGISFEQLADLADALVLSGGSDIDPIRFRQTNDRELSRNIDHDRDEFEFQLTDRFVQQKKPIMGICRGMQILNVYFGGDLYQDILAGLDINYPYAVDHPITSVEETYLHQLFGKHFPGNSLHHQSVAALGEGLVAAAYDSNHNQVVEAFYHETLPIYGVQWHPEKMFGKYLNDKDYVDMMPLFKLFLSSVK